MKIIKWLLLCGVALNVGAVFGACPWTFNKKITPNSLGESDTIYFCKEPRHFSHTEYKFKKNELIDSTPGEAAGNARYIIGSSEDSKSLATGTAVLTLTNRHANPINNPNTDPIKPLDTQRFSQFGGEWNQRSLFHFYKRGTGCSANWRLSNSIRTYLQENAHIFTAKAPGSHALQEASIDGAIIQGNISHHHDARVAIIDNVILSHEIDKTKTITGKMEFYWIHQSSDVNPKGLGGSVWQWQGWLRKEYCHFGIAVKLTIKTGGAHLINKAGNYIVTVGVNTQQP